MTADPSESSDAVLDRREVKQLQDTITQLRDGLEMSVEDRGRAIASACAVRDEEIRQLRDTVSLLRAKLEHAKAVPPPASPEIEAAQQLTRHLQSTIHKMRTQLEHLWAEKATREDELLQDFEKERRQLQETIAALRNQFEGTHEQA